MSVAIGRRVQRSTKLIAMESASWQKGRRLPKRKVDLCQVREIARGRRGLAGGNAEIMIDEKLDAGPFKGSKVKYIPEAFEE